MRRVMHIFGGAVVAAASRLFRGPSVLLVRSYGVTDDWWGRTGLRWGDEAAAHARRGYDPAWMTDVTRTVASDRGTLTFMFTRLLVDPGEQVRIGFRWDSERPAMGNYAAGMADSRRKFGPIRLLRESP